MKKSIYQQKEDDVKVLVYEAKVRNGLTDAGLAKRLGIAESTVRERNSQPGKYRMNDIWILEMLAGRPLRGGQAQ